jgi:hypothetical protein
MTQLTYQVAEEELLIVLCSWEKAFVKRGCPLNRAPNGAWQHRQTMRY